MSQPGDSGPRLPIHEVWPQIRDGLSRSSTIILQSPPGTGKSTVLPILLLQSKSIGQGKILLLQPRRVAAISVAARIAHLLHEPVGNTVGYRIRGESRTSDRTRIEVVTEGILLRMIQSDPELPGIGMVLFDEFHERTLTLDLGLALTEEIRDTLRPDLKRIVMSATLDTVGLKSYFSDSIEVIADAPLYPVEIVEAGPYGRRPTREEVAKSILEHRRTIPGNCLVFLPGADWMRVVRRELGDIAAPIFELYGELPVKDQQRLLDDCAGVGNAVILSTPLAETSLTVPNVSQVIDTGLRKLPHFDPSTGLDQLILTRISKDSAEQRTGRAGRLGPGRCVRLWTAQDYHSFPSATIPEVQRADVTGILLELASWGVKDPSTFRWLTAPPATSLVYGRDLLLRLEAIDPTGAITAIGRRILQFGISPRLGRILEEAERRGHFDLGCRIVSLLEHSDSSAGSSLLDELASFEPPNAHRRFVAAERTYRTLRDRTGSAYSKSSERDPDIGSLVAAGYPDRIAQRREQEGVRYLLSSGTGMKLTNGDPLARNEYLVVTRGAARGDDGAIYGACPLQRSALLGALDHLLTSHEIIEWNEATQSVRSEKVLRCGALTISRSVLPDPDPAVVASELIRGLRLSGGLDAIELEPDVRRFRARVASVGRRLPGLDLPAMGANELEGALSPYLHGLTRLSEVRTLDFGKIFSMLLTADQRRRLDKIAPVTIKLPKGKERTITYDEREEPVLEATVQELLGFRETPRLGTGELPLTVHVLSPARRPVQITRDLRQFWLGSYQEVRKELRGRYPRHAWPEDPLGV